MTATERSPLRRFLPVIVAAAVALIAIAVVMLGGGSDDSSSSSSTSAGGDALVFADVALTGAPLDAYVDDATDGAGVIGSAAPELVGSTPEGDPISVAAGSKTLVAFLAHWCPHCQAELPRLVDLAGAGGLDGLRSIIVLTGSDSAAPNFPPAAWLEREGWTDEVMVDDRAQSAAKAFGLSSYPYLVLLDADGSVIARHAGELDPEALAAFVDRARA